MSLDLQLPPELEAEIRLAAAREGVAPETYAVAALAERVRREVVPDSPPTESQLLERISAGLPPATWQRYRELTARRRDSPLTGEENAELLRLAEVVELWNGRRLELLLHLSRLRGVALRTLVEEIGLGQEPYA